MVSSKATDAATVIAFLWFGGKVLLCLFSGVNYHHLIVTTSWYIVLAIKRDNWGNTFVRRRVYQKKARTQKIQQVCGQVLLGFCRENCRSSPCPATTRV